jgi:ATP-dependent RNA helicase DeaD
LKTFEELGISSSFIKALNENNIITPTEIQIKVIPFLLSKTSDVIAQAQTGTGKTAAFGLPILEKVDPANKNVQALILSPTRELCQQIAKQLFRFTKFGPKIFVEAVYGGAPIGDQIKALMRPTQIVVATPGRLVDLLNSKSIDLKDVKIVVLDEADEMLSMGFKKELEHILSVTKGRKETWLFSATIPAGIKELISSYMSSNAFRIQVEKESVVNKNIEHNYLICDYKEKLSKLLAFLKIHKEERGVIFCRTKATTQNLAIQLEEKKISSGAIHGDLGQKDRDKIMRAFRNGKTQILIATDLAARGIDVEDLSFVLHYELPDQMEYYTHRSGRTARAGKKGISLAIIGPNELSRIKEIESELKISIKPFRLD